MKTSPACPDSATLARLRTNDVPKAERAQLVGHVTNCATCRAALKNLTKGNSKSDTAQADQAQVPVTRTASKSPGDDPIEAVGPTNTLQSEGTPHQSDAPEEPGNDWQACLTPTAKAGSLGKLGHYEVVKMIGRGGMGVVLRGFDDKLQRFVAIKLLAPALAGSDTARKRFVREARAAARVRDNHVVGIHEVDESGAVPYLVMEFIAGTSLDQRIKRGGPMGLKDILRIGVQIAEGLAAAHKQGLVHRDIKPGNILLESDGLRVKITDFGLARAVDDANLTQSGVISGTPSFMAPEQALGETVDHRADLFSLGSVLYAMCVGHSPFRATGSMAVMRRVCDEPHRPIPEIRPEIPEWFCAIVDKLLTKDREGRFNSAKAVADALRLQGRTLQEARTGAPPKTASRKLDEPAPPAPHRKSRLILYLAGAGVLMLALMVTSASMLVWWVLQKAGDDQQVETAPSAPALPNVEKAAEPGNEPARPKDAAAVSFKREAIKTRFLELAGGGRADKAPLELVAVFGEDNWLLPFGAHGSWIEQSPDGKVLAVPSNDTVALFDTETGKHLRTLRGIRGQVGSIAFRPVGRQIAVGPMDGDSSSSDKIIKLYDAGDGREVRTFVGSQWPVYRVAFAPPDGKLLASAGGRGNQGEAILWDVATGRKVFDLKSDAAHIRNAVFSLDGDLLATASDDEKIRIWSVRNGQLLRSLDFLPRGAAYGLAFSADGMYLAAGNFSRTMAWSTANWMPVNDGGWNSPGEWLAFRGKSHTLLAGVHVNPNVSDPVKKALPLAVVDLDTKKTTIQPGTGAVLDKGVFSLSQNGERLFCQTSEPQRCAFRPPASFGANGELQDAGGLEAFPVEALAISPDGFLLAAIKGTGGGSVWDLRTGQAAANALGGLDSAIVYATFSPDGKRLATSSNTTTNAAKQAGTLGLWNTGTGALERLLKGSRAGAYPSFSPDGKIVYAAGLDGKPKRWTAADGQPVSGSWGENANAVTTMDASSNGAWIATGGTDKVVRVLDAKSGAVVESFDVGGVVTAVHFSRDSKTLACRYVASSAGATITGNRLWEVPTWNPLPQPPLSVKAIGFAIHPTRRLVANSQADGTVRLWEHFDGNEQMQIFGPGLFGKESKRLAFTTDGKYLAVGGENGLVNVLRVPAPGTFVSAPLVARSTRPVTLTGWGTTVDPSGDCPINLIGTALKPTLVIAVANDAHDLSHGRRKAKN